MHCSIRRVPDYLEDKPKYGWADLDNNRLIYSSSQTGCVAN